MAVINNIAPPQILAKGYKYEMEFDGLSYSQRSKK
jgi:hypothetical protein